jgi:hypothetical protein
MLLTVIQKAQRRKVKGVKLVMDQLNFTLVLYCTFVGLKIIWMQRVLEWKKKQTIDRKIALT